MQSRQNNLVNPTVEDVVRSLYRCYLLTGNRAALVREHQHLKESLRKALYDPSDPDDDPNLYEPSPETMTVYAEVLAELDARAKPANAG